MATLDLSLYEQRGSKGYWYEIGRTGHPRELKACEQCGKQALMLAKLKREASFCGTSCANKKKTHPAGPDHHQWKGDAAGYHARHQRAWAANGPAREYTCIDCGEQAREWAQIHGATGLEPEHYEPRCKKCHVTYDAATHPRGERQGNAKLTESDVIEIFELSPEWSQRKLAKKFGVSQRAIWCVLSGESWSYMQRPEWLEQHCGVER